MNSWNIVLLTQHGNFIFFHSNFIRQHSITLLFCIIHVKYIHSPRLINKLENFSHLFFSVLWEMLNRLFFLSMWCLEEFTKEAIWTELNCENSFFFVTDTIYLIFSNSCVHLGKLSFQWICQFCLKWHKVFHRVFLLSLYCCEVCTDLQKRF